MCICISTRHTENQHPIVVQNMKVNKIRDGWEVGDEWTEDCRDQNCKQKT